MDVKIKNFRNIKNFEHQFEKGCINFIYAENGTGKTSIAKAIHLSNDELPKFKSFNDWGDVSVEINRNLNSYLFDDSLLSVNYLENNIFKNTYEVVFDTQQIKNTKLLYEDDKKAIKNLIGNEEYSSLKKSLEYFVKIFKIKETKNEVKLNDTVQVKAIKDKPSLSKSDITSNFWELYSNIYPKFDWISWINNANNSFHIEDYCPYCSTPMSLSIKESLSIIKRDVKGSSIKHIELIESNINSIAGYINIRKDDLMGIVKGNNSIKAKINISRIKVEVSRVKKLLDVFDNLEKVMEDKHNIGFDKIKYSDTDLLKDKMIISKLISTIDSYNNKISKINSLNRSIVKKIERNINKNNEMIETFLKSVGINYEIYFESSEYNNTQILLKYKPTNRKLDEISSHLSFGEKNIINAMFFLLTSNKTDKNVYLFDDPGTLFDKHKRFAFLNLIQTFRNEKIIKKSDYIIIFSHSFSAFKESITTSYTKNYILNNNNGECSLNLINNKSLNNYYNNILEYYEESNIPIVKLIMLRKLIETSYIEDPQNRIYNFISSLSKVMTPADKSRSNIFSKEVNNDIFIKIQAVTSSLGGFNHTKEDLIESINKEYLIMLCNNVESLKWYEKMIIIRTLKYYIPSNGKKNITFNPEEKILLRFITSIYHTENDHLFSIKIGEHCPIPKYVDDLVSMLLLKALEILNENEFRAIEYDNVF